MYLVFNQVYIQYFASIVGCLLVKGFLKVAL